MNKKRLVKSVLLVLVLLVVFVVPVYAQAETPPETVGDLPGGSDSIFGASAVIIALAFLVEILVEALFGRIADQIPNLAKFRCLLNHRVVGC